jgi:ferrous iron transport protein B
MSDLTIALAGNPNSGKSTVFNALTGLHQHTGNWPGKTVEKKSGRHVHNGAHISVVDLPGTYSLAAYSPDEIVARDFVIREHPDAVICVIDASNLERNLYLAVQVLELGVPVVIALNMADQAEAQGISIDRPLLSDLLGGVPVVSTVASREKGIDELLAATVAYVKDGDQPCSCEKSTAFQVDYGKDIESAIRKLKGATSANQLSFNGHCPRWMAIKLLENETDIVDLVEKMSGGNAVLATAREQITRLEAFYDDEVDIIAADRRYGFVSGLTRQVMHRSALKRVSITDRIDNVVTNRLIGLPIFMAVMYLVFRLVIDVSDPYLNWVDTVINGPVARGLAAMLSGLGAAEWLQSLVVDGAVAGVGGVLVFVPGLAVLYFFLSVLEDSGYMARAAFVMDRFMRVIGLHGKSVIPLMLGFGCAVPAIYATRTIANRRDRLLTALLIPFMSCSARLPVYLVFAMAFFGNRASTVIWLMYLLGVVVAILMGLVFSRTLLKPDANSAFVLELPPYRMPTLKGVLIHTWENTREFVRKAGTVILAISILLWFLLNLPWGVTEQRDSYYGRFSGVISPALEPAGFGNWESAGSLLTGFIAKELVVSTLSQIYTDGGIGTESDIPNSIGQEVSTVVVGFGEATLESARTLISLLPAVDLQGSEEVEEDTLLSAALRSRYSTLSAISFVVFVLLYIPCVATVSVIKQEFGWRWAATSAVYQTLVAWLAAVGVFQLGRFLGLG